MKNGDLTLRNGNGNAFRVWWETRTRNEKTGAYCFCVLSSLAVVMLGVYFYFFSDPFVICKTSACHSASSEIQKFIDENERPCDDFYRFACGGFLKNTSSDDPYSSRSVQLTMEDEILNEIKIMLEQEIDQSDLTSFNRAKMFYKACMNERAVETGGLYRLIELFNQMGGWPILVGDDWNPDNFVWTRAVRNLRAFGINLDFFFNVTVEVDREHPERYILGIHDRYFSPSELNKNLRVTFLDYMVDVASQFYVKVTNVRPELNEVLNFILELGKISEESAKSNRTNLYNPYSLIDLQNEFYSIHWLEYFQALLKNSAYLKLDDVVNVSDPVYLQKLEQLLKRTNKRVIANFIGWQIVQSLINYLPSRILNKAYDYLRKVNGYFYRKPRWNMCVEATRERLSAPLNIGYIGRYFNEDLRRNVTDLIRSVKDQFKQNLLMSDWLDQETKKKIMHMLVSSVEKIYSDFDIYRVIRDSAVYNSVKIEEDKLLKAVLDLDVIFWDLHYGMLMRPVENEWIKTQTFISGQKVVYSPNENVLRFPLGIFRGIYFNRDRPDYMNYGLLGTILAHQIAHIFVDAEGVTVGESREAEERLLNKWSPASVNNYIEKLQCLSSHYAKLELRDADHLRANPVTTRSEDVADVAAFKVAYEAFNEKEWRYGREPLLPGLKYNSRQLFWISSALKFCSKYPLPYLKDKYSDSRNYIHSPNEFRVNGPLQNIIEFSYDFGCKPNTFMNPEKKCEIW